MTIWHTLHPGDGPGADPLDARLHEERVDPATHGQRRHEAPFETLPDGAFVVHDGAAFLVLGDVLRRWTPGGYTRARRGRAGMAAG